MDDEKKADQQEPIQDETLDEVSGGYTRTPSLTERPKPPIGEKPPQNPLPHGEPT